MAHVPHGNTPWKKYFLTCFQAAVDCKTAGIMSCYSRPMPINANQTYRGVDINSDSVATSYNATLLQTLLRDTMGFEGFVNTDSNILFDIPWGVEELTPLERIALMYNAGSDIIGDWWGKPIDYSLALEGVQQGHDSGRSPDPRNDQERGVFAGIRPL